MTTYAAATIARITYVADCAHEDCALTTLKNAKDGIANRTKIHAGYETPFAGVDMAQLVAIFAPALKQRTKAGFIAEIEGIQRMMIDAQIEADKQAEILSRPHVTAQTIAIGDVVLFQGEAVRVAQISQDKRGFIEWSGEHVHSDSIAIGRMRNSAEYPAYYGDDVYVLMGKDADAQAIDAPVYHIEPITPDVFRVMVQGQHVATAHRQRNGKYNTEHGEGFTFLIDVAQAACAAVKARAELAREAARAANRLFGLWITRDQIDAVLADGKTYTAEQIARIIYNEASATEQRARYAVQLATAQQEYNAAQLATVAALDAAVEASTDGTEDTAEFLEYERTEQALELKAIALLQASGHYSIAMARHIGRTVAEVESLKALFSPYFSGNFANVHPGKRNELISKALAIPTDAASSAQAR
ncbi:hypothetical protein [Citrobacter portucalensis]|uniref:hypothetical protein n=1 Tax=Citrobacter portucalensis TaxID=1639133 RepID=UPI00226BBD1A|nr:hypothetical protein [Citrobacter portucalensis]MCX8985147.1 hypothetical protein [Citrobacter portucalensis]